MPRNGRCGAANRVRGRIQFVALQRSPTRPIRAEGKRIIASLLALKTGEGWLWAPELSILERVKFPKIKMFDSSRAPDTTTINQYRPGAHQSGRHSRQARHYQAGEAGERSDRAEEAHRRTRKAAGRRRRARADDHRQRRPPGEDRRLRGPGCRTLRPKSNRSWKRPSPHSVPPSSSTTRKSRSGSAVRAKSRRQRRRQRHPHLTYLRHDSRRRTTALSTVQR